MSDDPFEGLFGRDELQHHRRQEAANLQDRRSRHKLEGANVRMFLDDLSRALPYGGGQNAGFSVDLRTPDAAVRELIVNSLPVRGYRTWDLVAALRDYLESAVWYLVEDKLLLEIGYFWEGEDRASNPVSFEIQFLDPRLVTRRFGRYRHLVAERTESGRVRWRKERLDRSRIVVAEVPHGTRRELDRTLDVLRASDEAISVMTDFTVGKYGLQSGFDFTTYQKVSNEIVLRATRAVGWDGRGTFSDGLLDPQKAWRALQFARLQVEVRDIALRALQHALVLASEEIGFEAAFSLSGVLTASDVDEMTGELASGTRPIVELINPSLARA